MGFPAFEQQMFFFGERPRQMYAVRRAPTGRPLQPVSIVLVHGAGHTGAFWESTPDNRDGWVPVFLNLGYPVWTVDLPGHGRSPQPADFAQQGLQHAVDALHQLLEAAGPAVIMGHSMGGHTTFRTVGQAPAAARANIRGAVFLASTTAPELIIEAQGPPRPEDRLEPMSDDLARFGFCNSDQFPKDAVDNYLPLLIAESPRHYNEFGQPGYAPAAGGPAIFDGIPVIMLAADQDPFVTPERVKRNAEYFGTPMAVLGQDWGLPGHGHCFMIEYGNDAIAERIHQWIQENVTARV